MSARESLREVALVEAARQYRTLVSPVYGDDDERGAAEELDAALNAYDGGTDGAAHAGTGEGAGLRGLGDAHEPPAGSVPDAGEPADLLRDVPGAACAAHVEAHVGHLSTPAGSGLYELMVDLATFALLVMKAKRRVH